MSLWLAIDKFFSKLWMKKKHLIYAVQNKKTSDIFRSVTNPNFDDWMSLATALDDEGDYIGALYAYAQVLEIDPCHRLAFYQYCCVLRLLGNHLEAKFYLTRHIQQDTKSLYSDNKKMKIQ